MRVWVAWIGLLMAACQTEGRVERLSTAAETAYTLCRAPALAPGVGLRVALDTAAGGMLHLYLLLHNTSRKALTVAPGRANLLTADQRPQEPLQALAGFALGPGQEQEIQLGYQPVNDLYLYQRTGLRGPWQQQYRLPLSFIGELSDTLSFCFEPQAYLAYSLQREQHRPRLYRPSAAIKTREAAARQEVYWQRLLGRADTVALAPAYFTDQDFFNAGVNLRHSLFALNDSLYLSLFITNNAAIMLEIVPHNIWLQTAEGVHAPVKLLGYSYQQQQAQVLLPGDRLRLGLVYTAPAADSVLLRLGGLGLHPLEAPLFWEDFMFVQE
ncbi:hypothetical protein [Cesiribacter andamanensis]|nr:hypothetical protein [Cesiribacter andamanensis]